MTDDDLIPHDLITIVREPFAGIQMTTPAQTVEDRGLSIRRHRLLRVTAAGAGVAAALALVIFTVIPGQSARPAPVQLAAWTVTTEPNGIVAVTIRDLKDPAGLQRALGAHGVPAIVRFHPNGSLMPSCVISVPSRLAAIERRVFVQPPAASPAGSLLYIDPAAVPASDKIAIDAVRGNGLSLGLLARDGQCPPGSKPGGIGINTIPGSHP